MLSYDFFIKNFPDFECDVRAQVAERHFGNEGEDEAEYRNDAEVQDIDLDALHERVIFTVNEEDIVHFIRDSKGSEQLRKDNSESGHDASVQKGSHHCNDHQDSWPVVRHQFRESSGLLEFFLHFLQLLLYVFVALVGVFRDVDFVFIEVHNHRLRYFFAVNNLGHHLCSLALYAVGGGSSSLLLVSLRHVLFGLLLLGAK
mmetsp:Transcript_41198/g.62680  ORF Transcript_41198/g.62680 Transcript_41198/m.62680 type:complete len:201 (+) Transcript_41198:1440-2042(+)